MVSRESEKPLYTGVTGFTLIEMLVAVVLATLIIGGIVVAFSQFSRSFSHGEEIGVTVQEGGIFLAHLRSDLINAVPDRSTTSDRWREAVQVTPERLSFTVYTGEHDSTSVVEYRYAPGNGKGSITRSAGGSSPRTLVNGRIASLSWILGTEEITGGGAGSGTRFLWIDLQARLSGDKTAGQKGKELVILTKLFPARLIRRLN